MNSKKKILLVDDDTNLRLILAEALTAKNYNVEVISAKDPLEATDKWHTYKSSITHVIVDYYMPIDNGLELCKIIKSTNPSVKVILFSGDSELERSEKSGIVDKFFSKDNTRQLLTYVLGQ